MTLIEGKYSIARLYDAAETIVATKTANSKLLDATAEKRMVKFGQHEVSLSRVLGRGGFCVVSEISAIETSDYNQSCSTVDTEQSEIDEYRQTRGELAFSQTKEYMIANCRRGKERKCRYALKKVQESSYKDASLLLNGIVDLAIEAKFLAVLKHPNIIKMRATAACSPYDKAFFVVLDRLHDTLYSRLIKWKKQKNQGIKKLFDCGRKKEQKFFSERLAYAYDIASALKYLHNMNVMYRDIKPDNIGFDVRGDIKIFDFGLAKEFDPDQRGADGLYKLTADTGSPRYMDPVVAQSKPYDERCDVYSFCVLAWEMLELQTPFEGYSMNMFTKKVVEGGTRLRVNTTWPIEIQNIMHSGFGEITDRMSIIEVCDKLRTEISHFDDKDFNSENYVCKSERSLYIRQSF